MMKRNMGVAWLGAVALVVATGCGGGGEDRSARPSRPSSDGSGGGEAAVPAAGGGATGTASVKGAVNFEGEAPKAKKIRMDADPFCQKAHSGGATSDEVSVNDNGTLQWVFVYVKSGASGDYAVPSDPVTIDQSGCTYSPHVLGIRAGQTLKILNSDETLHNIHALPKDNPQFNIAMPKYVKVKEKSFPNPEVMVPVKCDVHSWMATYIGVLDHPFFAVTGADGSFDISGLPAGTYTIEAWHEKFGAQTQEVTVADGEASEISFSFSAS
jgi:plastocyanin